MSEFATIDVGMDVEEDRRFFSWRGDGKRVRLTKELFYDMDIRHRDMDLFIRLGDIKLKVENFDDFGLVCKRVQRFR